jgi:hypothetical protein
MRPSAGRKTNTARNAAASRVTTARPYPCSLSSSLRGEERGPTGEEVCGKFNLKQG